MRNKKESSVARAELTRGKIIEEEVRDLFKTKSLGYWFSILGAY